MGLRLACSCVNVTPHLWAWLAATVCIPEKMMRRELRCRWDGHRPQTLPGPFIVIIISAQGAFIYVLYSITSSSRSPQLLYTYHSSMSTINNWLPPSTGQCCIVCWHSWAPEGHYSPVVCGLGFTSVLQGRCWDQTTPPTSKVCLTSCKSCCRQKKCYSHEKANERLQM